MFVLDLVHSKLSISSINRGKELCGGLYIIIRVYGYDNIVCNMQEKVSDCSKEMLSLLST